MPSYDCIIVGAGISGLSTAYALQRRGANILLIESQDRVGGALWSEHTDNGFVLELGTQTVSSHNPNLGRHFEDLGIAQDFILARSQRVYLSHQNRLTPLSLSPLRLLRSRLLSTPAKVRLLAEPFVPRARTPDESVDSFFTRRFGSEFTRSIIDPFVTGVYGGDATTLSVRSIFPNLWQLEQHHRSLVLGKLFRQSSAQGKADVPRRRTTFNFRRGMETWVRALARTIAPERLWLNTRAIALEPSSQSWNLTVVHQGQEHVLHTSRVVLAVPSSVAATLVKDLEPVAGVALQSQHYAPVALVHLGYRRSDVAHSPEGLGMLGVGAEQERMLGTLWTSTIFPEHAPADAILTTTFLGGSRAPQVVEQDDARLIAQVQQQQQTRFGIRGAPIVQRVVRWPHAIPQYDAGHTRLLGACNRLEARWPGLFLIGSYRHGIGVEKCWQQGQDIGSTMIIVPETSRPEEEQSIAVNTSG